MNRDPMNVTPREEPEAYAQRRANETGRAYLVTMQGHAWLAFPESISSAEEWAGGIAGMFLPGGG